MTTLILSLFFCCLMPIIAKIPLSIAMQKKGGYNNKYPRNQQNQLQGFGARALAAHQNAWEAIAVFAPAVLLTIATNRVDNTAEALAIVFVVARGAYHVTYLTNHDLARSLAWTIGFGSSLTMIWRCLPN
ncbi:MAPEG family protein [Paraferrimonas sedimenticola]|uniref:MAPEG family protein n=1 Tax=Paraferrimonas sedimenticola TaxID=375674 RepID=UPI000BA9267F|nr:MAPEG family protein [Paraferrimonas sedimenticola]